MSTTVNVQHRLAKVEDAVPISGLMSQLGYEVSSTVVRERLNQLSPLRQVFVAECLGRVVGWIAVSIQSQFVTGRDALIEGFVVDESLRSRGIGTVLLEEAERWAIERRCAAIRVQSNVIRESAHRFYERNGFAHLKTQHHLIKLVRPCVRGCGQ